MESQTKAVVTALTVALASQASAAIVLFQDDFNDGDLSTPTPAWGGSAYNGGGNTNLSTQTVTSEVVSAGNSAIQLRANWMSAPDAGFSGTQLQKNLGAGFFDGYAAEDITYSFDLSVLTNKTFQGPSLEWWSRSVN